jgi:hypothetical protein
VVEVEMLFLFVIVGYVDREDDGGKEVVRGKEESRREALSRGDGMVKATERTEILQDNRIAIPQYL